MVRIEFSKRPDALDIDIMRSLDKGKNYPTAVYNDLKSIYERYQKGIDDETVRLRLQSLWEDGYVYVGGVPSDRARRFYLTHEGERCLRSTVVADNSSGRIVVYVSRDESASPPRTFSVVADNKTKIQVQDMTYDIGYGSAKFPLPNKVEEIIIQTEGKFARIRVDRGSIDIDRCSHSP